MLASLVIVLASFVTGGLPQVRHSVPANQELAFRHTKRRKLFSYASNFKRCRHSRIPSFSEFAQGFKFLLLNIKIKTARQLDSAWKIISPLLKHFIHQPIFCIEYSDDDASYTPF